MVPLWERETGERDAGPARAGMNMPRPGPLHWPRKSLARAEMDRPCSRSADCKRDNSGQTTRNVMQMDNGRETPDASLGTSS